MFLLQDGSRRRTPGGVYLTLLKQQPEWNKDVRKLVFVEDVEEQQKHRKETRKKLVLVLSVYMLN